MYINVFHILIYVCVCVCIHIKLMHKLLGAWPLSAEEPIEISGLSYAQVKEWIEDRDERWSAPLPKNLTAVDCVP